MTPPWLIVLVVAELVRWLTSPPASLAAAAEREALRRQIVETSVAAYDNSTLEPVAAPPPSEPRVAGPPAPDVPAPAGDRTDRNEAWWRRRMAALRADISRDENELDRLGSEIARLDGLAVSEDDPARQDLLRAQATEARAAQERARARLEDARHTLSDVLEEARRADVPPGWLR